MNSHIDLNIFNDYAERGLLHRKTFEDLIIFDYSKTTQFDRLWDDVTLMSRGLVVNTEGQIIARPFKKFFNWEEVRQTETFPKDLPYRMFDKLDGSLGICFMYNNKLYMNTRGSFASDQSIEALKIFHDNGYSIRDGYTYLFEIIYPSNRVVVDYGDTTKLILTAIIRTDTGVEVPYDELLLFTDNQFAVAEELPVMSFEDFQAQNIPNKEGCVVLFENGYRMKIKFPTYCRLHTTLSNINSVAIYEILRSGSGFEEMLEIVPDEAYDWVHYVINILNSRYAELESKLRNAYAALPHFETDKDLALFTKDDKNAWAYFALRRGNEATFKDKIWKMLRPEFVKFGGELN